MRVDYFYIWLVGNGLVFACVVFERFIWGSHVLRLIYLGGILLFSFYVNVYLSKWVK
ncbi:MAG: hypothetical protein K8R21_00610 [Leptospira sp.]|nr:hypothetical protein [Leptospira sp.]